MSDRKASREIARDAMEGAKERRDETAEMRFKPFSKVRPRGIGWLWKNRFAVGKIAILIGNAGVGKSLLTCHIAAVLSRAGTANPLPWTDGSKAPKGRVLFIACEDNPEDTIWQRLKAAGADLDRVEIYDGTSVGTRTEEWTLDKVSELEQFLQDAYDDKPRREYSAIIIDPVSAYLPADTQENSDAVVRGLLKPLGQLCDRWDLTAIIIKHLPKSATKAVHGASGSIAWTAAARAGYMVSEDPNDPSRVLFLPSKNNVAARQRGLAYQIKNCEVFDDDGNSYDTARIEWQDGEVTMTADEALNHKASAREGKEQDAVKFLKDELADGPQPAIYMEQQAKELKIAERTLERAKRALAVKSFRKPGSANSPWMWSLPSE